MTKNNPAPDAVPQGDYELVPIGITANGNTVLARRQTGPVTHTGGFNADGTPTKARLRLRGPRA